MTKQEILRELQDINIDAANYIYTENYAALNSLANSVFKDRTQQRRVLL